jgi:hypothetical protein
MLWALLPPSSGPARSVPTLGYGGCFVESSDSRKWFARRGVVTLQESGGSESRRDKDRRFEALLLASAPKGIIPASLIRDK